MSLERNLAYRLPSASVLCSNLSIRPSAAWISNCKWFYRAAPAAAPRSSSSSSSRYTSREDRRGAVTVIRPLVTTMLTGCWWGQEGAKECVARSGRRHGDRPWEAPAAVYAGNAWTRRGVKLCKLLLHCPLTLHYDLNLVLARVCVCVFTVPPLPTVPLIFWARVGWSEIGGIEVLRGCRISCAALHTHSA